jgi:putative phage-type endonuclease
MITHVDKSKDWHQWRKEGIGSSDSAAILGISPYKTPYQLWEEKTGKVKTDETPNYIQGKGNRLEPVARATYELTTGLTMSAAWFENPEYKFIRASFDGYNEQAKRGLEIKFQGKENHMKAHTEKFIVPHYMCQMQHQMLASGCEQMDFVSYNPECEPKMVIVPVVADLAFLVDYQIKVILFWNENVLKDKPPELTDADVRQVKTKDALSLAAKYQKHVQDIAKLTEEAEKMKVELLALAKGNVRTEIGSVRITRSFRKGNVDYAKIPELAKVNLDDYRKAGSSVTTLTLQGSE